jgi:hypothetical protein
MRTRHLAFATVAAILGSAPPGFAQVNNFGLNPQHTALSPVPSQNLNAIHWQTPVDLNPEYDPFEGHLFIHYGSPLVTSSNTVILPVRARNGDFHVEARNGTNGDLIWKMKSDYVLPPYNWVPQFGLTLTSASRVYFPGAGGTVYYRDSAEEHKGPDGRLAFYGLSQHAGHLRKAFQESVYINTPLVSDSSGNIYFGFQVLPNRFVWPLYDSSGSQLSSGIARIGADGEATWTPVTTAAGDAGMTQVVTNCAPAITADGSVLYIAVANGYWGHGYLLELNSATLARVARVRLKDPHSGTDATLNGDGTASPTIGPDGDVYYGVLEAFGSFHYARGWMLHFDSSLSVSKTPGSFGWDDTASIVPKAMVPSYLGSSNYLLMVKYNNYLEAGGSGLNKLAILDPNATQTDPFSSATVMVMKEVFTILGPTPSDEGGVAEWCINTAVVDPATYSVLVGSEDGKFYRWDLRTNTLTETITLTSGIGEAYTPTIIGVDGTVYAINNATLFALGQ